MAFINRGKPTDIKLGAYNVCRVVLVSGVVSMFFDQGRHNAGFFIYSPHEVYPSD